MKNIAQRPMVIAFEKNFPEAILAAATVLFGAQIAVPPDSLRYAQGYEFVISVVPSWTLGIVFLVVGLINLWGVLRRRGDLVRSTSKILAVMWLALSFLFMVAAIFSPGWIFLLAFGILYAGVSSEYRTKTKWFDSTDSLGPDM